MERNVRIDQEIEHYKGFFEDDWMDKLKAITHGTKIAQMAFNLSVSWWGVSNARQLPWLMIKSMKDHASGILKNRPPLPVRDLELVAESLTDETEKRFTKFGRERKKILLSVIKEKAEQAHQELGEAFNVVDGQLDALWPVLLKIPSFSGGLWASETNAYTKLYFDYESFISRSLNVKYAQDTLRSNEIPQKLESFLNSAIKNTCYSDPSVTIARLVRHAIVHNDHQITSQLIPYRTELTNNGMIEGDELVILAWHTTELYNLLKDRVLSFAKEIVLKPEIR